MNVVTLRIAATENIDLVCDLYYFVSVPMPMLITLILVLVFRFKHYYFTKYVTATVSRLKDVELYF